MLRFLFATFFLCVAERQELNFSSDFNMTYERAEIISYNHNYFSGGRIKTYKFNRTQAVSNGTFTLIKDLSEPLKIEIQTYRFMSNEYRLFPVRFSYSFCEALRKNDFGIKIAGYTCGNLSLAGCPHKKGTYHVCKFFMDGGKFPPHVPEGSYMVDIKWFLGETEIALVQGYGTIKYKNFWMH